MGDTIELQIKNPSQHLDGDFKLRVPQSSSVGEVKAKLEAEYPSKPDRGSITVIYAGRVLKQDDAPLATFLQQNVDPSTPHTLHIVIKPPSSSPAAAPRPSAPLTAGPASSPVGRTGAALGGHGGAAAASGVQPSSSAATAAAPATAAAGPSASSIAGQAAQQPGDEPAPAFHFQAMPAVGGTAAGLRPRQASPGNVPAAQPAMFPQPAVSGPIQGYAYTIPSPYAIYNPALTAAYTAALQALQAATPPAPPGSAGLAAGASSGPGGAAGAAANSAAAAAYNAARQSLQAGGQLPWGSAGAPGAGAPAGGPGQAAGAAALSTSTVPTGVGAGSSEAGAATAAGTAARPAGIAGQQTTAPVPTAGAAAPGHAAPAAAGMNGLGPAAGLGSLPPLALPLGAIAYVPAFIPIPQPVLTAIPNHSLQQYAQQVAAAQQGGAGQAGEGQQQPGQAPFMQGPMAPGLAAVGGQFFPAAGVMFPVAAQHPMQFHMGEPGEQLGLRRRRGDPNNQQAGALPPEVIEAMRAAQARGQLPNHLAPVLAQLQRQQAARRAEARRVRGFQIQINLGRINLRAVMQLLFMVVIMAPYFSMRRLALMLAVAAVLNIARLEGVRRALNRLVGQHHLPLHPEQPQQAQQQGQGQGEAGGAAGGFGGGAGAVPPAGAPGLAQQGQGQGQHNGAAARGPVDGAGQAGAALFGGVGAAGAPAAGIAAAAGEPAAPGLGAQPAGPQLGQQQQQQRGRPGIVQEIQALVVGFITSLLPGWNVNPEDAAAFAAAEEAARAEEQAAAAGGFAG